MKTIQDNMSTEDIKNHHRLVALDEYQRLYTLLLKCPQRVYEPLTSRKVLDLILEVNMKTCDNSVLRTYLGDMCDFLVRECRNIWDRLEFDSEYPLMRCVFFQEDNLV